MSNFSTALNLLKEGHALQRSGWNGKGLYVYLVPANSYPAVTEIAKKNFGDMVPYSAYLAIKSVDNTVVPWHPSQTDILADDWDLIPTSSVPVE